MDDLTPSLKIIAAAQEITTPPLVSDTTAQVVGGFMAAPNGLSQGQVVLNSTGEQILIGAATSPTVGTGIFMGADGSNTGYDFRVGDPSGHYIWWDASANTLNIVGAVSASSINIPDTTTANSFHVDSNGNSWWGTNLATGYATAPASILNDGSAKFSNITITGGSVASSTLAGLIGLANTNLAAQGWTFTSIFSSSAYNNAAWTSGSFTSAAGTTYSISSGSTGVIAALTYIYLDISTSATALQTTTTAASAVGAGKVLIGIAQPNTDTTKSVIFQIYNGAGGVSQSVTTGNIVAGAVTSTEIGSGAVTSVKSALSLRGWIQTSAFTVASATQVNWGAGTFTASDGTAYSISSGNTGTMAAKTFIYLDTAISTTAYQTTTTPSTAIGDTKVLIAIAQNGTGEASFMLLNNNSYNIDASNIVAGSVTANEIAAATIIGAKIAATTITASNIVSGTITGTQIAATTITASNIVAATITGTQIAASTITAGLLNVATLSAITANLGTITAGSININSGVASIDSSGNATFKSIQVGGSTRQYFLTDTGMGTFGDGSDGAGVANGTTALAGATLGTVSSAPINALIVGGGGGADGGSGQPATGGGAGQVISLSSFAVTATGYSITVGTGGAKATHATASAGGSSSAFGSTALGGSGGTQTAGGANGGATFSGGANNSGGGAGSTGNGSTGTVSVGGNGGPGTTSSISGASVTYAQGGGGGGTTGTGTGGSGIGDGGLSGSFNNQNNGKDGIVIISYPTGSLTATGGTITTSGGNTIHTFTSGGTFTVTALASNNIYTLTRDVYYTDLTVSTAITILPNGYRIFGLGTLTLNGTATISRNGNSGAAGVSSATVGSGASGGAGGAALADGYLKGCPAGGTGGGDLGGSQLAPVGGTTVSNSIGVNGINEGAVAVTATASNVKLIANWHLATLLDISSSGSTVKFTGSASSGGGSSGSISGGQHGLGGGGASPGGIIAIYFKQIVLGASSIISCNGGVGGKGGDSSIAGAGNGGSGGSGGVIVLVYNKLTNSGTLQATAGLGGAGGTGFFGPGSGGSSGNAGIIYQFQLSL